MTDKAKRLTIADIKRLTSETNPHFFTRNNLKFFHQRMSDFKVYKQDDGKYLICAPQYRDAARTKLVGTTEWFFNPTNNELELKQK